MTSAYFYPQKMGRLIFLGMEEIMGADGASAVLHAAALDQFIGHYPPARADRVFPFQTVSIIQTAFEKSYGPRGGRGIALRVGRSIFKHGLKEYGSMLGLTEMTFRLLPMQTKLSVGAKSFADLFNKHSDQVVRVEDTGNKLLWHIERCPLCWERSAEEPICHMAVGVLQEALYWISGGKVFNVEETACIAQRDASCTISIDKTPLS